MRTGLFCIRVWAALAKTTTVFATALVCLEGCASIPADSYGVQSLRFEGVDKVDDRALASCLATRERDTFALNLGASSEPECGVPPFDGRRVYLRFWRWPWTDWPLYDATVFERDLARIERWYKARGYYQTRIMGTRFKPRSARASDRVKGQGDDSVCERDDDDEGCRVAITISVEEGQPVLVRRLSFSGEENLSPSLREDLRDASDLAVGERFDEAIYDISKDNIRRTLRNETYACASVTGDVDIDPEQRTADIDFSVVPGPRSVIGNVRVTGHEHLSAKTIKAVSQLRTGEEYRESELDDAQRAIYALGAFASVEVIGTPRVNRSIALAAPALEQSVEQCEGVVDIEIRIAPGRAIRYGLGAGFQTGNVRGGFGEQQNVPQWDVHLLLFAEHRNFVGGLRRIRIEDRPRLIFQNPFPEPTDRALGNEVRLEFRQPAFIDARTTLRYHALWDLGPDPNNQASFRHDVDSAIGLHRPFLDGRLVLSGGLHGNLYLVRRGEAQTSDHHTLFWEQHVQVDLRDNPQRTTRGAFFAVGAHEGGFMRMPASWRYVRLVGEARSYAPLPAGIVIAGRFALGGMMILDADQDQDDVGRVLGPQRYRLRAGGPSSHRGFIPGFLGDRDEPVRPGDPNSSFYFRNSGGLRRWEASLEVRMPLSPDFGLVAFSDFGDMNRAKNYRFNHLNLAVGLGLRYQTVVGPLRLDVAGLVPRAQVVGGEENTQPFAVRAPFFRFPGAVHLTIGEAF